MCFLLRLSRYIFVPFLSEWLSLDALGCFDTALTASECRSMYLALLSHHHATFLHLFAGKCLPIDVVLWMTNRGFSLDSCSGFTISEKTQRRVFQSDCRMQSIGKHCGSIQTVDFVDGCKKEYMRACIRFIKKLTGVRAVKIKGRCQEEILASLKSPLNSLQVSNCSHVDCKRLLKWKDSLRELTLRGCRTGCFHQLDALSVLTSLKISGSEVQPIQIAAMLRKCSPLKEFSSSVVDFKILVELVIRHSATLVSFRATVMYDSECRYLLLNHFPLLTSLDIVNVYMGDLTCLIAMLSPDLKRLCFTPRYDMLPDVMTNCVHLEELRLGNHFKIYEYQGLENLKSLRVLDFVWSSEGLLLALTHCPLLSSVVLHIFENGDRSPIGAKLAGMQQQINLSSIKVYSGCDGDVLDLIPHMPNLTSVSFLDSYMSKKGMRALIAGCHCLKRFQTNDFAKQPSFLLTTLATHHAMHLEHLSIPCCTDVERRRDIFSAFPKLRSVRTDEYDIEDDECCPLEEVLDSDSGEDWL